MVGVADATFSVGEGEIFCIMGLSGSGKSTLVRHINRLIEPTDGRVLFKGEDVGALDDEQLRNLRSTRISMVFQHMALLPHRNVRENVAFALELRGVRKKERAEVAERSLQMVELAGWENHYPDELSGGMKQRVGLARALAADPEVLLMDEPFSALDPLIRRQLQDQFLELSGKMRKTTLFITHDLDEAIRLGSRIAVMKDVGWYRSAHRRTLSRIPRTTMSPTLWPEYRASSWCTRIPSCCPLLLGGRTEAETWMARPSHRRTSISTTW